MSPTIIQPRGRGRPPTHPVDRLRTRLWFHIVKLRSGLPSAYAIEMKLDGDRVRKRDADVSRPTKWDFYRDGDKVPDDRPNPRNAIEQAEAWFPGTARWFRSPVWPVLRGEKCDRTFVEHALRKLQPKIVETVFEPAPREYESHPRQKPFDADNVQRLVDFCDFDSLVVAVLLVALSEDIASPELRKSALHLYFELQPKLKVLPELSPFYEELFSSIDLRCKHWVYLSSNLRMDIVIFSRGVLEDHEKRAADRNNVPVADEISQSDE